MKLLGVDTADVTLVGKFTFTNTTDFPVVVSLWQTAPLYYRVIEPEQTWSTSCGAVWFTVKVWLYNGVNNINPGVKYSLLAGNIVGFAALGALGFGATALLNTYGVGMRNPDWEKWLIHNHIPDLSNEEMQKGVASIALCEFSAAGYYAAKHPHLYISGGPITTAQKTDRGSSTVIEWHELKADLKMHDVRAIPIIRPKKIETSQYQSPSNSPRTISQKKYAADESEGLLDNEESDESDNEDYHLAASHERHIRVGAGY